MTRKKASRPKPAQAALKINVERERDDAFWELADGGNAGRDVLCHAATLRYFPKTNGSLKGTFVLTTKRRAGSVKIQWHHGLKQGWEVNGFRHNHADPLVIGPVLDGLRDRLFYATFVPAKKPKPKPSQVVTAKFTLGAGQGAVLVGYDVRAALGFPNGGVFPDGSCYAKVEVVK